MVPLVVANSLIMSYIATNHFLNPLTEINDPLANTLSVTSPRWLEKLHLQFGYHVEHHLFPTLSGRHAPVVRDVLIRLYGDRYLTMPHVRALRLLTPVRSFTTGTTRWWIRGRWPPSMSSRRVTSRCPT